MMLGLFWIAAHAEPPIRSAPPTVTPAVLRDLPDAEAIDLGSGRELRFVRVPGARKVEIRIIWRRGLDDLDAPAEVSMALGWLWDVATQNRTAEALDAEKDMEDIDLWSAADHRSISVNLTASRDARDDGLEMLADVVRNPRFPRSEIRRYRRERRQDLKVDATSPSDVLRHALEYGFYPPDQEYGRRPNLKALRRVSRRAIRAALVDVEQHSAITILATGDLTAADLAPRLVEMLDGMGAAVPAAHERPMPQLAGTHVVAVDMPGSEQSEVAVRTLGPTVGDPESSAFSVVDWALGGAFLCRLNANLREKNGYTYGIYSSYYAGLELGEWTTQAEVQPANTAAAIHEIGVEVERIAAAGATAEEVSALAQTATAEWNSTLGTAENAIGLWEDLLYHDETLGLRRSAVEGLSVLTAEQTQAAAAKWLGKDAPRLWVVVGDRTVLEPQLAGLGFKPAWITPEQATLGAFPWAFEPP